MNLHHIAIQAEDFNESLRFYTTVLDFKVKHTWALPQYNIKQAALLQPADGGSGIELFDKDANVATQGRKRRPGEEVIGAALLHFAVTVPDAAAAYEKALANGAQHCIEPATIDLHPLMITNALVYGPNNEVIEFIERNELF